MFLDSGRDVWETTALVRIEWGLSAKAVTASVIVKTTIIILACVSSFVTVVLTIRCINLEHIPTVNILRNVF